MSTKIHPKLFILGIDGADFDIILHLINHQFLPNLSAFSQTAQIAPLRCTWPPHTATGWPTLFSGTLPGEHGIFQFWECQSKDYKLYTTQSTSIGTPYLWDALSENNLTVGLLNIPMSHPPSNWKGYQITWPLEKTLRYAKPETLLHEIINANGLALPDIAYMYDGQSDYPMRAKKYVRARKRTVQFLLEKHPTDVVAVVFTDIDRVCHHYWHEFDKKHPDFQDRIAKKRSIIVDLYREIDNIFGEILMQLSDDCIVLVVSDHGFGLGQRGLRLQKVLHEGGFLQFNTPLPSQDENDNSILNETKADYSIDKIVDWDKTVAYMPTPGCFGVNINLKGRQDNGIVTAEDQPYILKDLEDYFLSIRDQEKKLVFAKSLRSEQAYPGKFSTRAPDMLLIPKSPELMLLYNPIGAKWDTAGQTGLHYLKGIFMLRAPVLTPSISSISVPIEEVCGNLLYYMNIEHNVIPQIQSFSPPNKSSIARSIPVTAWIPKENRRFAWSLPSFSEFKNDDLDEHLPLPPLTDEIILKRLKKMGYM